MCSGHHAGLVLVANAGGRRHPVATQLFMKLKVPEQPWAVLHDPVRRVDELPCPFAGVDIYKAIIHCQHARRSPEGLPDLRTCRVPMVRCPYAQARLVVWIEEGW